MKKLVTKKYEPTKPKYDPTLDAYTNVVLFPKKVEQAIATIEKHGLPNTKKSKKPQLTSIQAELLTVFAINPSEQQMQQLKVFLHQLFGEQLNQSKKEAKMIA